MRVAFKMKIKPEFAEEYEKRHNPIWSELETVLKAQGMKSYSIFLDRQTSILFAYAEIEDLERWQSVANTKICQEWWDYMAPLMEVNEDNSPKSVDLHEVFHIESA